MVCRYRGIIAESTAQCLLLPELELEEFVRQWAPLMLVILRGLPCPYWIQTFEAQNLHFFFTFMQPEENILDCLLYLIYAISSCYFLFLCLLQSHHDRLR